MPDRGGGEQGDRLGLSEPKDGDCVVGIGLEQHELISFQMTLG